MRENITLNLEIICVLEKESIVLLCLFMTVIEINFANETYDTGPLKCSAIPKKVSK